MDGDTIPNVDECRLGGVSGLAMVNGGFESPHYTSVAANYPLAGTIPGWQTTDTNFEFWTNGFLGVPPYEGTQFVELNAFAVGTLYQDIPTTVGDVYIYVYSHRGRAGVDKMKFNLGSPASMATIRTSSTGVSAWGRYGGVITISNPISRFAFASVSSACGMSCGNLLDAISFTPVCDLDTDNDDTPDALDTDSDADGVNDTLDVCPGDDDATEDPDADLICGISDSCPLDTYNDWDADGVCGDVDACAGFDDADDQDNDTIPDGCDSDRDGDGYDESTDCDESDPMINAKVTLYFDIDGDTYGDPAMMQQVCPPYFLPMRVLDNTDCNDVLASIHPTALEIPDGLDQDCDLIVDEGTNAYDDDNDGLSEDGGDCDDDDIYIYPGGLEIINGLDDDCDLLVDDETSVYDDDNDGYSELDGDCNDALAVISPIEPEVLDGIDQNCNSIIDDDTVAYDDDNDGYTEIDGDCDDTDPDLALPQIWFEDRDNDGYGDALAGTVACLMPPRFVDNDTDCADLNNQRHPAAIEICTDKQDFNCDGSFGFVDADNDRWAACEECDDADALVHPGGTELCDDLKDNNCDGNVDENCPEEDTDALDSDTDELDTDAVADTDECLDPDTITLSGGWGCVTSPLPETSPPFTLLSLLASLGFVRRKK